MNRASDADDSLRIIYEGLANCLKDKGRKHAESEIQSNQDMQRIKCEFQGEKRLILIGRPVQYKELIDKIRQYYNMELDIYHAPNAQDRVLSGRIRGQSDLERALEFENLGRSSSHSLHIGLVLSGSGGSNNRSTGQVGKQVCQSALESMDRESPPPGTLPSTGGLFIPDHEEEESSYSNTLSHGGSSHSGSHSSLDSSYYSPQLGVSQTSPVGTVERVHGGTFPMSRLNGIASQMNIVRGDMPPNTFPRHSRRPVLPSSGSFSSLGSTGSSDWSMMSASSRSGSSSSGSVALLQKSPRSPAQLKIGRTLGAGVFGHVSLCLDTETGKEMAIKQIQVECNSEESTKEIRALQCEIQLLKSLSHDRIVQYYASSYEEDTNIFSLYMEYVPAGSVKDQIKEYGPLNENVTRKYTLQVLHGLAYLHNLMIVHRNIKGANILRDHSGNIKLSEFGLSKRLQTIAASLRKSDSVHLQALLTHYLAPEVIEGKGYGRKADIWSLGCTVVEMLTGSPPWHESATHGASPPLQHMPIFRLPESVGQNAHHFLSACFRTKPSERWTAEELLIHKFVHDAT